MGHKKQHRPKAKVKASAIGSTAAASASPAAPAPTPAPAELLGDALATLTLQPQAPKPPAPLAPPTAGSSTPCKASVAPDSASAHTEPGSEWEQVQGLHDSQGVGYLAAFTQVAPDLRKQADTGARGAALAAAAHRLCQAVQQHATHTSTDAAVAVLKAALKECKTSSAPHSQATLVIKYNLAQLLTDAQLYEAAAHTWLWVLPRAGRLPREAGYDQCQARLSTLQCLTGMGHYLEGLQLANDACGLCLESRGKEHPDTMRALKYLLVCHEMSVPLPPLTLLPLLQTYVAYLRRTNKGGVNDRELWERLRRLHCCQKELNDLQGATASSRELMQVARRCYGVQHERYFESMQYHAQNLTDTGDHAKAIALFIQILQHHMRVYGDSHRNTATAALSLGHTYFELDRFKEGAAVFERVWPHARKSMRGDTDGHMVLFEHYMYCLIGARDLEGARKLRDEALARRLPAEEVRYVYDSLLTAPASEFE